MMQDDTTINTRTDANGVTARGLAWLRLPVDGAALAVFRMMFGILVVVELSRTWSGVKARYLAPLFHFKYYGFEWVQAWPGDGLYWHLGALSVAALYVALGLLYRCAAALTFLSLGYLFLLEQSEYRDEAYLACLVAFLLCWLPAQRTWSLDARGAPSAATTVPRWAPLSLMLLMQVVLIYSGLSRLNPDWLAGYPMKLWLRQDGLALVASYLALALYLLGAPLLFFRKTRVVLVLVFGIVQIGSALVSDAGLFSLLTVAGLLLFLDPSWPRALIRRLFPGVQVSVVSAAPGVGSTSPAERLAPALAGVFLLYNLLMPVRPLLYAGNAAWSEEGQRFSWRGGTQDKQGQVTFLARNPRNQQGWSVDLNEYLTPHQTRVMATQPDLVIQFAHHLAGLWQQTYRVPDVQIFAQVYASLNGRPLAPLVNQLHDLAGTPRDLRHAGWILSLAPEDLPGTRKD